jgi:hypothetical protein
LKRPKADLRFTECFAKRYFGILYGIAKIVFTYGRILFKTITRPALRAHPASYPMGNRGFFPGSKAACLKLVTLSKTY